MNKLAAVALTVASMFLIVMAVLVNSSPLFYMTVAVVATLGAARLQAWMSVRALRFERSFPPSVSIGEPVTIETIVWSEKRLKRPLVFIDDVLPQALLFKDRTPSLPVAPSFDQPIKTRFTFRPLRRGRFRWHNLLVVGTDALGLGTMEKVYSTDPVELTVYPVPIPVYVDIQASTGLGISDIESGFIRGSGIDSRGIREYAYGDPLKHVHWRSSARLGRLMVKEFETGSGLSLAFLIQQTSGTETGPPGGTTFEAMCGHALYLADSYLDRGAYVWFPGHESYEDARGHAGARARSVREVLTDIQADQKETISDQISRMASEGASTLVLFISQADSDLPTNLASRPNQQAICLIYDPKDFQPDFSGPDPMSPTYIAQLESAGARIHLMPHVEAVS